jgi:uncharacterized protein (TIGR02996 family)
MARRGKAKKAPSGTVRLRGVGAGLVAAEEHAGAWIRLESFREVRGRVRSPLKCRWFGRETEESAEKRLEAHVFAELRVEEGGYLLSITAADFDLFLNGRKRAPPLELAIEAGDVLRADGRWLVVGEEVSGPRSTIEASFLRDVRQAPTDDDVRRVYADWLEEREDFARADFIRLDLAIRAAAEDDPSLPELLARFRMAAKDVGSQSWRTAMARPLIENCDLQWELVCPKRWESLTRTERFAARHCDACDQPVILCATIEEARSVASRGGCVAVDPAVDRSSNDLHPRPIMVGRVG